MRTKQQELQASLGDKADIQRQLNEQSGSGRKHQRASHVPVVIGLPPPEKSAQAPVIGSKRKKLGKSDYEFVVLNRLLPPPAVLASTSLPIASNRHVFRNVRAKTTQSCLRRAKPGRN